MKGFWDYYLIRNKVFENLLASGFQNDIRSNIESDALNYIHAINNYIFRDEYIEDYLYRLVGKLYPFLPDGRIGHINIHMEINPYPNATIFSNGTLIITTGLFSCLNSEKELLAVLAHEIAHFMLDHTIININAIQKKAKQAEFWAGIATMAAAASEVYLTIDQGINLRGNLTTLTSIIAYSTGQEIVDNFGYRHSREQELAADQCAIELLKFIGEDPRYLSNVFSSFLKYNNRFGIDDRIYKESSHPSLRERIKLIGDPITLANNNDYNFIVSRLNTLNSAIEFQFKHFTIAEELIQRNILANVATQQDYLIKARIILIKFDDQIKNLEALSLIEKAKNVSRTPMSELFKVEGIIQLRLKRKDSALISFKEYLKSIEKDLNSNNNTNLRKLYSFNFLEHELSWVNDMIQKCQ